MLGQVTAIKPQYGNLPGGGGVFNYVYLHVYHYGANNTVKYVAPNWRLDVPQMIGGVFQTAEGIAIWVSAIGGTSLSE